MKCILVGVDGSPESLDAVAWTAELARSLGCDVVAVSVFGIYPAVAMPNSDFFMTEDWRDEWQSGLRRDLDGDWTKALRDAGVKVTTIVEEGEARAVLLRLANEYAVDLIVVGSRGHGVMKEMFLGSVSHGLALCAPCAVVVLPHHQHAHHEKVVAPPVAGVRG